MKITITRPDDLHLHLRQGEMLSAVLPATASQFGRALVMPNTDPPILTAEDAVAYRRRIEAEGTGIEPLMTIKLVPSTTPAIVRAAKGAVVAGKLYPEGVTTNSDDGVSDLKRMYPVFEAMQDAGLVLCLHGERPDAFCIDREAAFLADLYDIAGTFPRLRIVLEHVTTAGAVQAVAALPDNVAATITVHHLYLTLDDVIGGALRPHAFCKPVAKRPEDREALIAAAIGGDPKFFLGTDSAPHARERKECDGGCAGVFTAPVAMPALAAIFEGRGALDRLEGFASVHGAAFYGLPKSEASLTLVRERWAAPAAWRGVVPFLAGKTLDWRVG